MRYLVLPYLVQNSCFNHSTVIYFNEHLISRKISLGGVGNILGCAPSSTLDKHNFLALGGV
jgi:hypothetical protein